MRRVKARGRRTRAPRAGRPRPSSGRSAICAWSPRRWVLGMMLTGRFRPGPGATSASGHRPLRRSARSGAERRAAAAIAVVDLIGGPSAAMYLSPTREGPSAPGTGRGPSPSTGTDPGCRHRPCRARAQDPASTSWLRRSASSEREAPRLWKSSKRRIRENAWRRITRVQRSPRSVAGLATSIFSGRDQRAFIAPEDSGLAFGIRTHRVAHSFAIRPSRTPDSPAAKRNQMPLTRR